MPTATYKQIVARANHVCDLALDGSMILKTVTRANASEATDLAARAVLAARDGDIEEATMLLDTATLIVD